MLGRQLHLERDLVLRPRRTKEAVNTCISFRGAVSIEYSENHFSSHIYPNHTHNCKRK